MNILLEQFIFLIQLTQTSIVIMRMLKLPKYYKSIYDDKYIFKWV